MPTVKDPKAAPKAAAAKRGPGFVEKTPLSGQSRGDKLPDFGDRARFFYLAAHASSWELIKTSEGWRLVPTLKRIIVQPGVNWTKQPKRRGDAIDRSILRAKAEEKMGFEVITKYDDYLYGTPGLTGTGHFLKWESVRVYRDGKWEIELDADGYALWRWSLVTEGTVEAPRQSVIAEFRSRLKKAQDRASRTPHLAQAQRATKEAGERLKGLEAALEAIDALGRATTDEGSTVAQGSIDG